MIRKYLLPVLAVAGILFALWMVAQGSKAVPPGTPVADPPRAPFANKISGAGIVEASTRNISVGSPVSGIVYLVFVKVGVRVRLGDPLFMLDSRKQRADLAVKEAALAEVRARLARLREAPRPEEVPAALARVDEAEANLKDLREQLEIAERVKDPRAISIEDLKKRRHAVEAGEARLALARADLKLLNAGSWKADIEIALANVAQAEAEAGAARVEIERLTVRAPVEGDILQINVRPGEFAPSGATPEPLLLMGNLDRLHVRVDIDENDAWRFQKDAKAVAFIRGNPQLKTDLAFEYVEAYVVPKRSLTGDSTERVDTRVMQVIYSFRRADFPIHPGQLMDVYIDHNPAPARQTGAAPEKGRTK